MIQYLKAKISEYSIILERINNQILLFDTPQSEHPLLLHSIKTRLLRAQEHYQTLTSIVKVGDARLLPRGLEKAHLIEFELYVVCCLYIPALQNERQSELAIRKLLLSITDRFHLTWIQDLIVKQDGPLATIPRLEAPLFIAPPKARISLLEMPGFYHEIGHNFFERFSNEILSALKEKVDQHFNELQRKAGLLNSRQEKNYKKAADYWTGMRLEEIFCDIFATWTCGIAHYVSCVDMGFLYDKDPYELDFDDEHPPVSARVYACWKTLTDAQQLENLTKTTKHSWFEHLARHSESSEYRLICVQQLLDCLVETSINKIEEFLPEAKRYNISLPDDTDVAHFDSTLSFEDILNRSIHFLMMSPDRYSIWESNVMKTLGL